MNSQTQNDVFDIFLINLKKNFFLYFYFVIGNFCKLLHIVKTDNKWQVFNILWSLMKLYG